MPLYALGSNGMGQLGVGHEEDLNAPQLVRIDGLKNPIQIAAGGNHTLILQENGVVHTVGDVSHGRCADNQCAGKSDFAKLISMVAATWTASTYVSAEGSGAGVPQVQEAVYGCGQGMKGELGLGIALTSWTSPKLLEYELQNFPPRGTKVVDISSSMGHTVVVLDNGTVYGWGQGRKGQLGQPEDAAWSPRKIEGIPFPVKRVACGKEFTYLVGDSAQGHHMILGADKWSVKTNAPEKVPDYVDIGAAWGSIYVLLHTGRLLSWGRNDHKQLAPDGLPSLDMIAVGSEHVLAKTSRGKVIAWGWGEHGNCGVPINANGDVASWNHIPVQGKVKLLGAGCATSFIYTE
ncbi:RCC1/BLIP-II [Saccharata proteae CBS 121410]|uniref:RCC1/BLIP-II n=1 Tax=Saccharata proteae CBS 121410 TaxID=1314787 RepID=A0A9P4HWU6_9PEZI|nr:RCC1/BLIP-II [Saccharata proteae CBS 121410]